MNHFAKLLWLAAIAGGLLSSVLTDSRATFFTDTNAPVVPQRFYRLSYP
jgi:hypothetical protein